MNGRFVAYYRVSTARQGVSGLGLDGQREAVRTFLNGGDWTLLREFVEVESGRKDDRPQLAAAMAECKLTGATLLVAKLDRLSRNMAFTSRLMESGVDFKACDNPHATPLTIHILAAVAQHEREMISARTTAALAAAKARGTVLGGYRGGPKVEHATGLKARQDRAAACAASVRPIASQMRAEGLSLRQIAAALATRGISTPRGGAWTAAAVNTVLAA